MNKKIIKKSKILYAPIYIAKYKIAMPLCHAKRHAELKRNKRNEKLSTNGQKLIKYKHSHAEETCVIVGNGPSANIKDLEKIQILGLDTFGTNKIIDIFNKTEWRPTFVCVCDSTFLTGVNNVMTCDEYNDVLKKTGIKHIFMADYIEKFFKKEHANINFVDFYEGGQFASSTPDFCDDAEHYVGELGTVTNFAIQLAVFMGYKNIYLYGMDNTYTKYIGDDGKFYINNSVNSHMAGMNTGDSDDKTEKVPKSAFEACYLSGFGDVRKSNIGYKKSRQYAEINGIKIINITRGGHLEIFERKNFEEVFM